MTASGDPHHPRPTTLPAYDPAWSRPQTAGGARGCRAPPRPWVWVDMGEVLRLPRCARSLGMTGCCLGGQLPPRGQPLIVASGWALLTWQNETGLAIRAGRRPAKNPRRCRRRRGHPQAGRVPFPVNEKRPAPGRPFQESGKRDSNPRRSAWEFPSRPSRPALPRSITGSPSPARPVESRYSE